MHILDFLFPPRVDERVLRGVSVEAFLAHISPRLVDETRPETVALLPFAAPPVRAALHEAKYHGSEHAFTLLGSVLAEYLLDTGEHVRTPLIIPVPLSTLRKKERGYNQVEEVAKRAGRVAGMPLMSALLIRTRDTASQVSLPRHERVRNMRGAFRAPSPLDPLPTYILVDDVLTTGATLQAAVDALEKAGARQVVPIALAH